MKKILIILSILAITISLFTISSMAADDVYTINGNYYIPKGTYKFSTTTYPSVSSDADYPININFICNGVSYSKISRGSGSTYYLSYNTADGQSVIVYKKSSGYINEYSNIEVTESTFVTQNQYNNFFLAFELVELSSCTGGTCSALDVNRDNICDDCGAVFAVLRDYTPTDFPSGYPPVPSLGNPDARYYLYRVISSDIVYIVAYPSTVTPTYDSTKQNGQLYFSESYGNYRLDETNNEWVLSSDESPYTIGGNNSTSVENLYSSVQIKDENGENFFPIPLWEKVEKVTKGEIPTFQTTLGGTITTLTLCGVGLIALLVVLSLFGKVLSTYRR